MPILSFLDTDLYKFTMQQAVYNLYREAEVEYRFINRGRAEFPAGFADRLRSGIAEMQQLQLTDEQYRYLLTFPYFTAVYLYWLRNYRYNPNECSVQQDGGDLKLTIQGPWHRTILWEVPLMSLISELYFDGHPTWSREERQLRNKSKALLFQAGEVQYADFGTRRRFSSANHHEVLCDLLAIDEPSLVGTSNVHFAHTMNLKPIGTMAHEWIMFHGAVCGYQKANPIALKNWFRVFGGELGVALTDTYTSELFFREFTKNTAVTFAGVRHDSGDPLAFADRTIKHYQEQDIDPKTKLIVFSDGLNPERVIEIKHYCKDRINVSFGIGTNLTNDVNVKPLNMVIKMVRCREIDSVPWRSAVKLSDEPGKHTGDPAEIRNCLDIVGR